MSNRTHPKEAQSVLEKRERFPQCVVICAMVRIFFKLLCLCEMIGKSLTEEITFEMKFTAEERGLLGISGKEDIMNKATKM